MQKFRYIIISVEGPDITGTNNETAARRAAEFEIVIDTETSTHVKAAGEESDPVIEVPEETFYTTA